jgi:MFS transporter, DHA2 family, multidrug resistance protein
MLRPPDIAALAGLDGLHKGQQAIAIVAVLTSMALVVLDAAMVNVATPTIADALGVDPAKALRIVSVYQTALVMALLPCAALGESLGYRRVFASGLALFIIASALSASAPTLDWLVAARFLQGLGGAAIMALGIALLRQVLPAQSVPRSDGTR